MTTTAWQVSELVLGCLLLTVTMIDFVWSTLGTHGAGPLSRRFTNAQWAFLLALHRRFPRHRALSFAGSFVLGSVLVFWIALLWTGWVLVFSSAPGAVVASRTGAPAGLVSRIYFVGYGIFTMGNGDYGPRGGWAEIATALTAGSGIVLITVAISYLISVLSATAEKRTLAAYVAGLGNTPAAIITNAWNGRDIACLEQHSVQLAGMINLMVEHHLAYPVLLYMHSEVPRTAIALRMAALYDAVLLMTHGLAPEIRLRPGYARPLRHALEGLTDMVRQHWADPTATSLAAPSLALLRAEGVPVGSEEELAAALVEADRDRRTLLSLILQDGWSPEDIGRRR